MSLVKIHWLVLGGAAALAALIPYQLLRSPRQPEPLPMRFSATAFVLGSVPGLDAAFSTPLFSVDRMPPAAFDPTPGMAAGAASATSPDQLPKLVGIALGGRGVSVALVKQADGQTRMLHPGEEADGWRLTRITRNSAQFRLGGEIQTLTLDFTNRSAGNVRAANDPIPLPPPSSNSALVLPAVVESPLSDPTGSIR